jgi:hypothetical protein
MQLRLILTQLRLALQDSQLEVSQCALDPGRIPGPGHFFFPFCKIPWKWRIPRAEARRLRHPDTQSLLPRSVSDLLIEMPALADPRSLTPCLDLIVVESCSSSMCARSQVLPYRSRLSSDPLKHHADDGCEFPMLTVR